MTRDTYIRSARQAPLRLRRRPPADSADATPVSADAARVSADTTPPPPPPQQLAAPSLPAHVQPQTRGRVRGRSTRGTDATSSRNGAAAGHSAVLMRSMRQIGCCSTAGRRTDRRAGPIHIELGQAVCRAPSADRLRSDIYHAERAPRTALVGEGAAAWPGRCCRSRGQTARTSLPRSWPGPIEAW